MQKYSGAHDVWVGSMRVLRGMILFGAAGLLVSCASSPHVIELRNGRELIALNEPEYQSKTGYFRYLNKDERDAMVRAEEVLHIVELED